MKQPIDSLVFSAKLGLVVALFFVCGNAKAIVVASSNPGEWTGYAAGASEVEKAHKNHMTKDYEILALQGVIAAELEKIKEWEKKYYSYLKTAEGYAQQLKAAATIWNDGGKALITLWNIKSAVEKNPEGIVATISMNNLYMETISEFLTIGTMLELCVAKGGEYNMLNGKERTTMLYAMMDKVSDFRKKLDQLYLSIRYYKMLDVWNSYTSGLLGLDKGDLAAQARERWVRRAREHAKDVAE